VEERAMRHLEQTIDQLAMRVSELEARLDKMERDSYFQRSLSEPVEVIGSWQTSGNLEENKI
jgi:hypothetical protein